MAHLPLPHAPFAAIVIAALGAGGVGGAYLTRRGAPPAPDRSTAMDGMAGMPGSGAIISPARQQLIGVRTAIVREESLDTSLHTVGSLTYDETRVTEIHTKVS